MKHNAHKPTAAVRAQHVVAVLSATQAANIARGHWERMSPPPRPTATDEELRCAEARRKLEDRRIERELGLTGDQSDWYGV